MSRAREPRPRASRARRWTRATPRRAAAIAPHPPYPHPPTHTHTTPPAAPRRPPRSIALRSLPAPPPRGRRYAKRVEQGLEALKAEVVLALGNFISEYRTKTI